MEYRKLEDLRKLENNPRKISSEDFQILVKSIKDNPDYFEARPLLLSDRTGELVIIAGNQRYDAAKVLISAIKYVMDGEENPDFNSDEFKDKVIEKIESISAGAI